MKRCKGCNSENSGGMNFCINCGTRLPSDLDATFSNPADKTAILNPSNNTTEKFERNRSEPTVNKRFGFHLNSIPTIERRPPRQGGKLAIILALLTGIIGVVFLGAAVAGVAAYAKWQTNPSRNASNPKPEVAPYDKPDINPYPTPNTTPIFEPEKRPAPNNDLITFPAPKTPTKHGKFVVRNLNGWQISEIKTVSREQFRVSVKGRIKISGKRVSASGTTRFQERRIYKQFKTGALLMRTHYPDGSHSNIQQVTAFKLWQNFPDETGKIEFIVNDRFADQNEGQFTVTVTYVGIARKATNTFSTA